MSFYQRPSGSLKVPDGKVHFQMKRLSNGQFKQITVESAYPSEVKSAIYTMIARDSGTFTPKGRNRGFFGNWSYTYSPNGDKPDPVELIRDFKDQGESPNFTRAKNSGEIVMNAAVLSKVKLKWHPVEKPAADPVPVGDFPLHKQDFKGIFEAYTGANNYIKLSNGNWYDPSFFRCFYEFVPQTTWSLPFLDMSQIADSLCYFDRDGEIITTAAANLNEATLDILTEMAELPETLGMFKDAFSLFSKRGKKMKKLISNIANDSGSPSGMMKNGDRIASARLLYRYGILPLKYTVDDAKDLLNESFKREYVAGQGQTTISEIPDIPGMKFSGGYSQVHRAFFKRRLDPNDSLSQFQNVFSINLPKTVYELTPWSLVVDWFINAGDYLTAVNLMPSLEEAGCYSCRIGMNGRYTNKDGNILEVDLSHYSRSLINRISDSSLRFRPVMNNDRYMDAFAFSWQIIRGKIKKLKK